MSTCRWKPVILETSPCGHLGGSAGWASAFCSGYDPNVLGWSLTLGSLLSGESASPSALIPACALSFSFSLR